MFKKKKKKKNGDTRNTMRTLNATVSMISFRDGFFFLFFFFSSPSFKPFTFSLATSVKSIFIAKRMNEKCSWW